ncbi:uncharacterized protein LOC142768583 isoform X3 [Rhipicephalus microplus]|uniref:uncharacterized protein LOC142768583 isoform X3 n=1 Tax=Rhipicephalus microplus TaxID=6941 RepID=UPI003F6D6B39
MTYRVDMLISRASTGCFLSLLYLLYALAQGPSCAYAATAKPGQDPLYYFPGRTGGARLPRRHPTLPTIREGVTSESARPAGREQLLDHPDLRGSGPPPVTQFLHQGSPPRNQGLVHLGPPQRGRPFLLREYQFLYGRLA